MRSKSSKSRSRSLSGNAPIAVFTASTRAEDLAVQSIGSEKRMARALKYPCKSDGCTRRRKRGRLKLMVQPLSPIANAHLVSSEPKTTRYRFSKDARNTQTFTRVRCFSPHVGLGKQGALVRRCPWRSRSFPEANLIGRCTPHRRGRNRLGRGRTSNLCPRCAPRAHGAAVASTRSVPESLIFQIEKVARPERFELPTPRFVV
jgi:hypothetical protein